MLFLLSLFIFLFCLNVLDSHYKGHFVSLMYILMSESIIFGYMCINKSSVFVRCFVPMCAIYLGTFQDYKDLDIQNNEFSGVMIVSTKCLWSQCKQKLRYYTIKILQWVVAFVSYHITPTMVHSLHGGVYMFTFFGDKEYFIYSTQKNPQKAKLWKQINRLPQICGNHFAIQGKHIRLNSVPICKYFTTNKSTLR